MGDWYNKSDWTVLGSDCIFLHEETDYLSVYDVDIMLHTTDIIMQYCSDCHDMTNNTLDEADINNNRRLVSFGDRTYGVKETLPIITKARLSAFSFASQPIVIMWLLTKKSHYKHSESYHRNIVMQGKEVPCSQSYPRCFGVVALQGGKLLTQVVLLL